MSDFLPYDEKELLSRVADGDEAAFRSLYLRLYRPLLFFAQGLIHQQDQSEDIVMVAFVKFWEHRSKFTELSTVKSFLYTTVRHACYRYSSQLAVRERHAQSVDKNDATDDDFIESRIVLSEMIRQIRQEIELLNPIYREVVRLLYLEELSVKETANRLAITEENVRKRKERAIELLRNRIVREKLGNLGLFYLIFVARIGD